MRKRRPFWSGPRSFSCKWLTVLLPVLLCPMVARGHAILLHTDPIANQRLESVPDQIVLIFNERVEPTFNSLRVLDKNGQRLDDGKVHVEDGDTLMVSVPQLKEGGYGVFWRVTSLDGHQVQGQFGFGVRTEPPTEQELSEQVPQEQFVPAWYFPATRGVVLAALSLWMGGLAFLAIIFRPLAIFLPNKNDTHRFVELTRRSAAILATGAAVFFISEILWLWGKSAALIGTPMGQAASWSVLTAVLTTTRLGGWWMVRVISSLVLLLLSTLWFRPAFPSGISARTWAIGSALSSGVILASLAASGHAQAVSRGVVAAEVVDWLHLAATVVWVGGLVHLLIVLATAQKRWPEGYDYLEGLTTRFSTMAQFCVLTLVGTGIYNAWLHVPSWSALVSSDYGRVLSGKLALVLAILVVAAMNRQRVLPAIRTFVHVPDKMAGLLRRLQKSVSAEVVLGGLILGLVALLTNLPPATTAVAAGPLNLAKKSGDFTVALKMDSNKVGKNQAAITLTAADGRTVSDAKRVTVYLRSLDMDMGLATFPAALSPPGIYTSEVVFSMAGQWLVTVEVSPPRGDTFLTEFTVSVSM